MLFRLLLLVVVCLAFAGNVYAQVDDRLRCQADLDSSGVVDFNDFILFSSVFNKRSDYTRQCQYLYPVLQDTIHIGYHPITSHPAWDYEATDVCNRLIDDYITHYNGGDSDYDFDRYRNIFGRSWNPRNFREWLYPPVEYWEIAERIKVTFGRYNHTYTKDDSKCRRYPTLYTQHPDKRPSRIHCQSNFDNNNLDNKRIVDFRDFVKFAQVYGDKTEGRKWCAQPDTIEHCKKPEPVYEPTDECNRLIDAFVEGYNNPDPYNTKPWRDLQSLMREWTKNSPAYTSTYINHLMKWIEPRRTGRPLSRCQIRDRILDYYENRCRKQ